MPLIIISGYPSSGKTFRAQQIVQFFRDRIDAAKQLSGTTEANGESVISLPKDEEKSSTATRPSLLPTHARLRIHHISDDTLGLARDVYGTARAEKDARATAYSAVKRVLGPEDVVVLDGMNYIKGWRYQLNCEAKAMHTGCCVVHVGTSIDKAREINEHRLQQHALSESNEATELPPPYPAEIFENLVFRYEEPNALTRWDSPLFVVPWDDDSPDCAGIWDALLAPQGAAVRGNAARPNLATALKPATRPDHLYEMERITGKVVTEIREWLDLHGGQEGGDVKVNVGNDAGRECWKVVELPAAGGLSFAKLQRLKRQFVGLHRQQMGTMSGDAKRHLGAERVGELFVDYLNDNFQDD